MTVEQLWTTAPTLFGEHVHLRPTVASDADGLAQAFDDPDTLRFFAYGIDSEPPSAATLAHVLSSDRLTLTQLDARDGRIIGTTALYNMSQQHGRVTVGFTWLSARCRGTAINPESKLLVFQHIFETLGARRAELNVDDLNLRSRAAVLALGARHEGALRNHARRRDGTWRTTMVYSVTDDEWPTVRTTLRARIAGRTGAPDQPGRSA